MVSQEYEGTEVHETYTTGDTTAPLDEDWLMFRACSLTRDFASSIEELPAAVEVVFERAKHACAVLVALARRILGAAESGIVGTLVNGGRRHTCRRVERPLEEKR
jgi:hypothetical protein